MSEELTAQDLIDAAKRLGDYTDPAYLISKDQMRTWGFPEEEIERVFSRDDVIEAGGFSEEFK